MPTIPMGFLQGIKVNGAWSEFAQYCRTEEVRAIAVTHFDMSHLDAGTYYRIELRAHNAMGFSQPSTLMLKTARGEFDSLDNSLNTMLYEASLSHSSSSRTALVTGAGMLAIFAIKLTLINLVRI